MWRILPQPNTNNSSFLVCCMQSGARLVSLSSAQLIEQESAFVPDEQNPLIYGGSWQSDSIAALCSFYEKKLYICRPNIIETP